ncbi:NADP-dependent oxidoreductase domain-containing protein [Kockovaella imperatae]|uniref:NADP-dependent oxidoreductase domain-containing protein n=1 Tax=Kockovaella imperatae TaxID=4999 RepID=A0A1Y1UCP5_9TREE|nr:NADP-dependent oxidoreductase domain-containing protein [Kockovaella imperatae]ORX35307.1 NADP-dependent oxidoreductase domain-containing protein [Kockovaella imperatae]
MPARQCFETLKYVIQQAKPGEKMVINSAEFYGPDSANLKLLSRFFTRYPELSEQALVVVKGGMGGFKANAGPPSMQPDSSSEALRLSVEGNAKALSPKRMDVFELGRIDKSVPIEEAMKTLVKLRDEGWFDYIGLSECSAATLERAVTVSPILTVEIEISPMAWEEETRKVLAVAEKPGVNAAILAYSPMGRGAFVGISYEDIPAIVKKMFPRFQEENWANNKKLQDKLKVLAEQCGVPINQLALAWVLSTSPNVVPIPGTTKLANAESNFAAISVELSDEDLAEMTKIVEEAEIHGQRFPEAHNHLNWG